MKFPHFNRRLHLYLGLGLLPWFLLYGVSSAVFSHGAYFDQMDQKKGLPNWTLREERPYDAPVPEGGLRPLGARIVSDLGLNGSWGAYQQSPTQVNVYVYTFWRSTQVKYFVDRKMLRVEDKRFRWDHFLTGAHAKGGFEQESWLNDSWGVLVDVVALGLLVWVASGLYLWWHVPGTRRWGWLALAAGIGAFALLLARL